MSAVALGETLRDPGYGDGSLIDSRGYSYFPQDDGSYADVYGRAFAPDGQGNLKDALGNLLEVPADLVPGTAATSPSASKAQKRRAYSAAAAQSFDSPTPSRPSPFNPGDSEQAIDEPADEPTVESDHPQSHAERGLESLSSGSPIGLDLGSMYSKDAGSPYLDVGNEPVSDGDVGTEGATGETDLQRSWGDDRESYDSPASQPESATGRTYTGEPSQYGSQRIEEAWSQRIHKDDLLPTEDLSPSRQMSRDERISP